MKNDSNAENIEKKCECESFDLKDGRLMLIVDRDCPNKQKDE